MRFGVLTISDRSSRGERPDLSGQVLVKAVTEQGWTVVKSGIVPDEMTEIKKILTDWADSTEIDILLTTGGTGFAPRDVTPEATLSVLEKLTPGLSEGMRTNSLKFTPHAMLSRAVSGIRKQTIIVNLPGSPKAALENFRFIIPVLDHASKLLSLDPGAEQGH